MTEAGTRDILTKAPETETHRGESWALVVGITKYAHEAYNLKYAAKDASAFLDVLCSPETGSVGESNYEYLVDERATRDNVWAALRTFLKKPARDDTVYIYFACHGVPDPDRPRNTYLLTHDVDPTDISGTALPMDDVRNAVHNTLESERVVIFADACHSAAIAGDGTRSTVDASSAINAYLKELRNAKPGLAILTSAEASQVAREDARWGGGHGVFTYYLVKGMKGAADRDGNGIVTLGELFDYVQEMVKSDTDNQQHPAIGTTRFSRDMPITRAMDSAAPIQSSSAELSSINPIEPHAKIESHTHVTPNPVSHAELPLFTGPARWLITTGYLIPLVWSIFLSVQLYTIGESNLLLGLSAAQLALIACGVISLRSRQSALVCTSVALLVQIIAAFTLNDKFEGVWSLMLLVLPLSLSLIPSALVGKTS